MALSPWNLYHYYSLDIKIYTCVTSKELQYFDMSHVMKLFITTNRSNNYVVYNDDD